MKFIKREGDIRFKTMIKEYFSDDERFADMMNGLVFNGCQIIHADMLSDYEMTGPLNVELKGETIPLDIKQDVIKKYIMDGQVQYAAIVVRCDEDSQVYIGCINLTSYIQ